MARVVLAKPVIEIHGALEKGGEIINRQKKYRDEHGRVVHEGIQESYAIRHPRDFKKNPPRGAELANITLWTEACRRTSQILQAGQEGGPTQNQLAVRKIEKVSDYYTIDEARAIYEDFRLRFQAQLPNTRGKHADPQAPIDPNTGSGKRYSQLPNFIRAIIFHQLKQL
jgi:hypothetical protein